MKKKNILIACAVAFGLALVAIGTYAFLTMNLFTANSIYNTSSTCFVVDYGVTNDDSTSDITGVLFPGLNATAKGSLKGKVSLKINSSCDDINGLGSLYLHLNTLSGSSLTNELKLMSTITTAHCENPYTLQTLNSYQTSSACTSAGGTWVTSTSALKYAIYDNAAGTGEPLKVGNIASDSVNTDILVYDNILITRTQKSYYIFIWLDGHLTDNTYVDLGFSGNIKASSVQKNNSLFNMNLPSTYQQVEYVSSENANTYIDTGYVPNMNTAIITTFSFDTNQSVTYAAFSGVRTGTTSGTWSKFYIGVAPSVTTVSALRFTNGSSEKTVSYNGSVIDVEFNINGKTYVNGTNIGSFNYNYGYVTDDKYTLIIFADMVHNGSNKVVEFNSKSRLYKYQIYDKNILINDYVPCYRKSDNRPGLYDLVNNTFLTDSQNTTSKLSKGNNV